MKILCDTDILSCFAKIEELHILKQLFPNADFLIPTGVYEELVRNIEAGFNFPHQIFKFVKKIQLSEDELEEYSKLLEAKGDLGKGELQCIIIAKNRKYPFLTNDKVGKKFAKKYGIKVWNILEILKAAFLAKIREKEEIEDIILKMREKDNMIIRDFKFR